MRNLLSVVIFCLALPAFAGVDEQALDAAIMGDHRSDKNSARDIYRHPAETLRFFDVQAHHTVVEVWPGGGWYTEILAPYLRQKGELIAASYDMDDTQASYRPGSRTNFEKKLAEMPDVYDKVSVTSLWLDEEADKLHKGAADPGTVDRVLVFRSAHGWHANGTTDAALEHFFDILKPGGKLGLVQHQADPGQDWRSRNIGYVGRDYIVDAATRAGFVLHSEAFFNANPLDNKRYENGVWQLPPSLRKTEGDARKPFLAIGESDRMTLLFAKPES